MRAELEIRFNVSLGCRDTYMLTPQHGYCRVEQAIVVPLARLATKGLDLGCEVV